MIVFKPAKYNFYARLIAKKKKYNTRLIDIASSNFNKTLLYYCIINIWSRGNIMEEWPIDWYKEKL